jgi:hypothetical protein
MPEEAREVIRVRTVAGQHEDFEQAVFTLHPDGQLTVRVVGDDSGGLLGAFATGQWVSVRRLVKDPG